MSAKERAVVEAELAGAPKIEAEAKKINKALGDTKRGAEEGIAAGFNKATASAQVFGHKVDTIRSLLSPQALLGGVIGGAVLTSIKAVNDYLGEAAGKAREFQDKTSGAARRSGADMSNLRMVMDRTSVSTLQGVDAQLDYVDAVQKTSYGGKGAAQALQTVGDVATALGRKDADFAGVTVALQRMQGASVDVGAQLKGLVGLAAEFKTVGGPQSLIDGIAQLGQALERLNPQAAEKLKVLRADLEGKGYSPGQATSVASESYGLVKSRWMDLERNVGHRVLDERGNPIDPVQTMKEMRALTEKKYGTKDTVARRFATFKEFGPELGSAILGTDWAGIEAASTPAAVAERERRGAEEIAKKKAAHLASPEGQRELQRQKDEEAKRAFGAAVAPVGDWFSRQGSNALSFLAHGGLQPWGGNETPAAAAAAASPPTVHLSPESADAVGRATATAMKANPPKIEIPINPNAPAGN